MTATLEVGEQIVWRWHGRQWNAAAWKKHPARNVAEVGWLQTPVNLPKPTKPRAVRPKVRKLTVESTQVRTLIKKSA
jgi:hypothetical protein